jgi:hypothetical protein
MRAHTGRVFTLKLAIKFLNYPAQVTFYPKNACLCGYSNLWQSLLNFVKLMFYQLMLVVHDK